MDCSGAFYERLGSFRNGKDTPRIDVIVCRFVHPVTSLRGVVFAYIYILLRQFVGWFGVEKLFILLRIFVGWVSFEFTSYYVYLWVRFDVEKNTPRVDVIHGKHNPIWYVSMV